MARGAIALQVSTMASNPYSRPKDQLPNNTTCELCDRTMRTQDWAAHKNSKRHRQAEEEEKKEKETAEAAKGNSTSNTNDFGGDSAGCTPNGDNFTTDNSWGGGGADASWGSSGGFDTTATSNGYGDRACHNCGAVGYAHLSFTEATQATNDARHRKIECPNPRKPMGGSGGSTECYNCKQTGHISRDCPEPKIFRCRNCDSPDHQARECDKPKDWSRVKCRNCQELGHGAARCPHPTVEVDNTGGWGGSAGDGGAAAGDWGAVPQSGNGEANGNGNWADEATVAAGGDSNNWGDAATASW